ncbi:MAG: YgiQ family radical SAM protein [Clostridiales bacterium]
MAFLPTTKEEINELGWGTPDFVLVTGDAYIDHPSFGAAIIGRVLEERGYKVAILSQPDWQKDESFQIFGEPQLGFLVTGGNIDSMVAHYTVAKRKRSDDKYTPGNIKGKRPDRAVTVYSKKIRELYPESPIILGGIEASLRRLAHYDYWANKVLPSILVDSEADLLVYGMGEKQIVEIAQRLSHNIPITAIKDVRGTVYATPQRTAFNDDHVRLASLEKVTKEKSAYCKMTKLEMENADYVYGKTLVQNHGKVMVVQNPPAVALSTEELDSVYALPYEYGYPQTYEKLGGVKALEEVEFSIAHNRGCFGGCNFCSIPIHQGRFVVARSHQSVLKEAEAMTERPNFKGYINDVGGATANFRGPACSKQEKNGVCAHKKCLYPQICPSIKPDHSDYLKLLRKLRNLPKVKKVFIRSGIRYDYLMADKNHNFLSELVEHHVSGQLRVAPEHVSKKVLQCMGKPEIGVYEKFSKAFYLATKNLGKDQYILPYLMSSHPGSTMSDAVEVALWLKKNKIRPEQVQDFYPTPGTVSTAMYYTEMNPFTEESVYVPKSGKEKQLQRALLQTYRRENYGLIKEALEKAGREDLLTGKDALVPFGITKKVEEQPSTEPKIGEGKKSFKPKTSAKKSGFKPKEDGEKPRLRNKKEVKKVNSKSTIIDEKFGFKPKEDGEKLNFKPKSDSGKSSFKYKQDGAKQDFGAKKYNKKSKPRRKK